VGHWPLHQLVGPKRDAKPATGDFSYLVSAVQFHDGSPFAHGEIMQQQQGGVAEDIQKPTSEVKDEFVQTVIDVQITRNKQDIGTESAPISS
jgi:hypothetical protein